MIDKATNRGGLLLAYPIFKHVITATQITVHQLSVGGFHFFASLPQVGQAGRNGRDIILHRDVGRNYVGMARSLDLQGNGHFSGLGAGPKPTCSAKPEAEKCSLCASKRRFPQSQVWPVFKLLIATVTGYKNCAHFLRSP